MRVMVIDDDPVALKYVSAAIASLRHEVIARSEALGTLLAVQSEKPDAVIVDVQMPGLSGSEVARLVRDFDGRRGRHTILVLYSSAPEEELAALATKTGADGFIGKGLSLRALLSELEGLLAGD